MRLQQRTLQSKIKCTGIGLHSGKPITLEMLPAPEDSGIVFVRTDVPQCPDIAAVVKNVQATQLATTLATRTPDGAIVSIATVEHLLAALAGMSIDNVRILLNGPEVPILDGSAAPFVQLILDAGIECQRKAKRFLVIKKEVKIQDGDKIAKIKPSSGYHITCSLDFDHPVVNCSPVTFSYASERFYKDIAQARTFCFLKDVEAMRARGLALGGSLENAIVIDQHRILNPEGLRYTNEFVRHKLLDAIGDLSLFGMPIIGRVKLHRSGHAFNVQLVKAVLADPKAYEIVQPVLSYAHADVRRVAELEQFAGFEFKPIA